MDSSQATREILWNISHAWLMYVLLVPTVLIAGYGLYQRIVLWRKGVAIDRFDSTAKRLKMVVRHVVLQIRLARNTFGGVFHGFIFWGFVVFLLATGIIMVDYDFNIPLMRGHLYLYFQSLVVDFCGAAALIGLLMAGVRRWLIKPGKLVYTAESNFILAAIIAIILTGFLIEGSRIAATNDYWAAWSPVGYITAQIFSLVADKRSLPDIHRLLWWCHLILAYTFIAWAPYTKMRHALTSIFNVYTANLDPIGASLKAIDMETAETLGVNNISDFTWKDLLDLDACTECGRCTDNCPAATVGKPLSPRDIILGLRKVMVRKNREGRLAKDKQEYVSGNLSEEISSEALWECTTCAACVDVCPVYIEQMPKIVDMRRYLAMEEAQIPETILDAVMSLEDRGHPFRGVQATRLDWTEGLDVPLMSEKKNAEVLLWVGSASALLERSRQATRALARLLKHAGVDFVILGREEKSCGDMARRVGNEFLFETLARENIDTLARYNVTNIITACPHSYNTLKNEYPCLGGKYNVYHHTEYLWQLMKSGRLSIPKPVTQKVVYHDPCYLGRYNGIFDAPRELLKAACGVQLQEMRKAGRRSFCCGGGGGMSFADDPPEKRINRERARHALATSADVLALACPYCMTMMEDGVKAIQGDRKLNVKDIAELVWDAVNGTIAQDNEKTTNKN
ncbi:MAG: (Fe-S)-binding protein [Pseudomonadota bacterium]